MAHAAELDTNNIVIRVLVFDNSLEPNVEQFAADTFGGNWVQTSYNGTFRKNFAGVGYVYDSEADAFTAPQPECGHPELQLDTDTYRWSCDNADHAKII